MQRASGRGYHRPILRRRLLVLLLAALAVVATARPSPVRAGVPDPAAPAIEVVVVLHQAPAAPALRAGAARTRAALGAVQRARMRAISRVREIAPEARIGWRYGIVLTGFSLRGAPGEIAEIARLPEVAGVYPSVTYRALGGGVPSALGAPAVWGPAFEHAGDGLKIGVIDDGIDASHRFFDPAGYTMPEGFPRGAVGLTSAKVIVARAFPPPGAGWRFAGRPFDPVNSFHGTHVAGIAAGNAGTVAPAAGGRPRTTLSGVAPRAYLGNYKALTVPTPSGLGLNGNSPEIVAAIEAAVADGMDVINLSLGEPQVDPARDAVALALDNAAAAGVVPVVAAGNDYGELRAGSVGSPGTSERAITVAATDPDGRIASFSAAGPTPLGDAPKPDVSAPGVDVLSSVPGGWEHLSGTSMASPAVAGAAAVLLDLHPAWTVDEVKSALVLTGRDVRAGTGGVVSRTRQGGGLADLPAAASPLLSVRPQSIGFGLVDVSDGPRAETAIVELGDAGEGEGEWRASVDLDPAAGVRIAVPRTVTAPGRVEVALSVEAGAAEGERTGSLVLERGGERRRLPLWLRVTRPRLPDAPFRRLSRGGTYAGTTRGGGSLVSTYRYPEASPGLFGRLRGPERVLRLTIDRPVANLGAAIVRAGRGVDVEPRIVLDADENRLTGATSLPFVNNPWLTRFGEPVRSAAALLPGPGEYAIIVDSRRHRSAGAFRVRVWVDDVTPPSARLVSRVARGGTLRVRVRDSGAGVDPESVRYRLDGRAARGGRLSGSTILVDVGSLRPGRHRLRLTVSDRQEAKNNENVPRILTNTTVLDTTFRVP